MAREAKGRLFKRKDGKVLIYVAKALAEDSMFPFKDLSPLKIGSPLSLRVKISFNLGEKKLIVEESKGQP